MKITKVRCPCCEEEFLIDIDKPYTEDNEELSREELQNVLIENKIEFG